MESFSLSRGVNDQTGLRPGRRPAAARPPGYDAYYNFIEDYTGVV
jgi:hypothetical protein